MLRIYSVEGLADGLAESSWTWPRSGTMRNGIVYQLPMLARRISGTGYGLLLTPTKNDGFQLTFQLRNPFYTWERLCLGKQMYLSLILVAAGKSLPEVVSIYETMMGYPDGWTESE